MADSASVCSMSAPAYWSASRWFGWERRPQSCSPARRNHHVECQPERARGGGADRRAVGRRLARRKALLIGVVGDSFDVTTELGPRVAPALPRVLEMVADVVRRNGAKAERRAQPLPSRQWWESEQPA